MREAEENIKFKMEIDVLVPIPRTVTRDFTSLKHLRQWQKRNDYRRTGKASFGNEAKGVQPIQP